MASYLRQFVDFTKWAWLTGGGWRRWAAVMDPPSSDAGPGPGSVAAECPAALSDAAGHGADLVSVIAGCVRQPF